ncbi:MAG TPA: bifunctional folylpolyglutamate synthase/dihydrofolate synthase, partial [Bacteroidales bacterium]|nr:bifunctional folylpolyglutamate synthase/dihydrofolate synthase [Bacteroidales bacterium]
FGLVSDKDVAAILGLLPADATYYFCKPDIPRGLDVTTLLKEAEKQGLKGKSFDSVGQALKSAQNAAKENDLVFVGGSTFVVAEIL